MTMREALTLPASGIRGWLSGVTPDERVLAQRVRTVAIFLAVVVVAFHYSLSTLLRTLKSDTPLAYLSLVPLIALALAFIRARETRADVAIYDREVDYIVGLPLLLASLAINVLLPVKLSTMFWVWRVDLLALPLFVAGSIALLFGVRALWRARLPIFFLFLAWPLPYTMLLMRQLQHFTDATIAGVNAVLAFVPLAHQLKGSGGSIFLIQHGHQTFQVSVASACSGVNGLVGYALIGVAFLAIVKGPLWRKLTWLTLGLLMIWLLNVGRILLIFAVGKEWGQAVALDALHPYLGLVTFSVGVMLMLTLLGRFGLTLQFSGTRASGAAPGSADGDAVGDARPTAGPPRRPDRRPAVPKTRLAVAIVVFVALLSGVANASLKSFDLVSDSFGNARLAPFLTHPRAPEGWRVTPVATYDWAQPFFGDSSKWYRYQFTWDGRQPTKLKTSATVLADVISTDDPTTFSTYGIEACYNFHGYDLRSVSTVDLGVAVAHVLTYHNSTIHSDWTNAYWIWPVRTKDGTRFERVNLMMIKSAKVRTEAPIPSASIARSLGIQLEDVLGAGSDAGPKLVKTRAFLAAFAYDLVQHQPRVKAASGAR
jgi:exosortase/archaeosortase family protein